MDTPIPPLQTQNLGVQENQPKMVTPQKPSSRIILFIAGTALLVTAIVYLGYQNWQLKQQVSRLDKIIQVDNNPSSFSSLAPSPGLTASQVSNGDLSNWKTYTDPQNQYSVKYPPEFTLSSYSEGIFSGIDLFLIGPTQIASGRIQTSLFDGVSIKTLVITNISIPLRDYAEQRRIAESQSAPKDDPQPTVSKLSEILVGGKSGYRYTVDNQGRLAQVTFVSLVGNILQIVARSVGSVESEKRYTNLVDQILSTFKFVDNNTEGTLEASVIRSPTCPGAAKEQEICEAPDANETFQIISLLNNEIKQTVTTDKDGKFTISLTAGSYKLQNSIGRIDKFGEIGGIGKNIRNSTFTITSGKTTTQRFDVDTGIR